MRYIYLAFFVLIVGCSPIATYPPVENDAALRFSNSASEPVPTIMTTAIIYAHENFGGMDVIVFNLPVGIGLETYTIVADRLGGATPMTDVNQIAYHIVELRVRGFRAEADIVFPTVMGDYKEATLYLTSSIVDSWAVTRERVWKIHVQKPSPNMVRAEFVEVIPLSP